MPVWSAPRWSAACSCKVRQPVPAAYCRCWPEGLPARSGQRLRCWWGHRSADLTVRKFFRQTRSDKSAHRCSFRNRQQTAPHGRTHGWHGNNCATTWLTRSTRIAAMEPPIAFFELIIITFPFLFHRLQNRITQKAPLYKSANSGLPRSDLSSNGRYRI